MYGDDTWLKLFPDTFFRYDGTSSFFVSVSESVGVMYLDITTELDPPGFHRSG